MKRDIAPLVLRFVSRVDAIKQYAGITMALIANRYWILLALFAAATVSYSVGFIVGFGLLIGVGLVFELAFWHQLIKRRRRP